jgi:hypothetical protein
MKVRTCLSVVVTLLLATGLSSAADLTGSLKMGTPDIKFAGPLAFGPEGLLFVADTQSAAIFAIATEDTKPNGQGHLKAEGVDQKIATLLGTNTQGLLINDMAVNPASGNLYFSVSRGRGPDAVPVLVRLDRSGKLSEVSLKEVKFSKATLPNAPADDPNAKRGSPRRESITDLAFVHNNQVIVAGLSTEEFASTLRIVPFPFKETGKGTGVEIYHGAHGAYETRSPIRTFTTFKIDGEEHLLASYVCTPLVKFSMAQLKPGDKVRGTTIAELGNRNRPLDMIVYQKGGKDYLLLANNARGVMKIELENAGKQEAITAPVRGGGTAGLKFETIEALKGVEHLDKLDDNHAVLLVRDPSGVMNVQTIHMP